jgi:hypothetical protein
MVNAFSRQNIKRGGLVKLSNVYGVKSKSVIDALTHDDYDLTERPNNVFSATEIIDAPKYQVLKRRHLKDVTVDVSDNFHLLDGSAVHHAIEMSNKAKGRERLSEERIFIEVPYGAQKEWRAFTLPEGGKITEQRWYSESSIYVSVKFDNFEHDEGIVEDYKRCSAWEAVFGIKPQREQQLNIGALGLILLGFEVKGLRACLFLKDWSNANLKSAEGRQSYYPPIPYKEFDCRLWAKSEVETFVVDRVAIHWAAWHFEDDKIPVCDEKDRWYRGESFAVTKEGNKVAKKVFKVEDYNDNRQATENAARDFRLEVAATAKKGEKWDIQTRPGIDQRCNGDKVYCPIREYCSYWKEKYSSGVLVTNEESY